MFETRHALAGNQPDEEMSTNLTQEKISDGATYHDMEFRHFPALENVLFTSLFARLDRRVDTRIKLEQLAPDVSSRIYLEVKSGQKTVAVRPVDISLSDICVESENAIAEHGAHVEITLNYDGLEVVLPAIAVRHCELYARSAFLITGSDDDNTWHSRLNLGLIVHALETEVERMQLGRFTCFMLSAVCSFMVTSWMIL